MSGHSKWATIHRAKEVKDAKRSAVFTKLAAAITIAVKQGGGIGDPDKNFKLRLTIDKARQFNMPKENIARSIEKGTGLGAGEILEEALYEGFLPGGAAVLVETTTNNKLRTAQEVRMVLDKNGGTLGGSGAVSYMFVQKGELIVKLQNDKSAEEQELEIIDLGVEDVETEGNKLILYCDKDKTYELKESLEKLGYVVESVQLIMKPNVLTEIADEENREKIERILNTLEDLEDVSAVWSNYA